MKALYIIKSTVLEINKQLKKEDEIIVKKNFEILGPKSNLDSIIIVNFFIALEEKIKFKTGKEISLLTDNFLEKGSKKKYTIADLEKYLDKKIK